MQFPPFLVDMGKALINHPRCSYGGFFRSQCTPGLAWGLRSARGGDPSTPGAQLSPSEGSVRPTAAAGHREPCQECGHGRRSSSSQALPRACHPWPLSQLSCKPRDPQGPQEAHTDPVPRAEPPSRKPALPGACESASPPRCL